MCKDRMQRRHGTKHHPRDREINSLEQKPAMPPDPPRKARITDIRMEHIRAAGIQTEDMPALVERQTHIHPDKRDSAQDGSDEKRGTQGWVEGRRRGGHFISSREDHQDEEVDGKEMRFPEEVEESQMTGTEKETAAVKSEVADCAPGCESRV